MSESANPSLVAILAVAGRNEVLVMHNVVAMVDIERAAFFGARRCRAEVSQPRTGA